MQINPTIEKAYPDDLKAYRDLKNKLYQNAVSPERIYGEGTITIHLYPMQAKALVKYMRQDFINTRYPVELDRPMVFYNYETWAGETKVKLSFNNPCCEIQ